MRTISIVIALLAAVLSACDKSAPEPDAADLARAEALRPQDPKLAERYERSCMSCHAVHGSGAPLAGFMPQWNSRLGKGMDQLVRNTYDGFNAMPARGLCNDCSQDDLRALIRFMSGAAT